MPITRRQQAAALQRAKEHTTMPLSPVSSMMMMTTMATMTKIATTSKLPTSPPAATRVPSRRSPSRLAATSSPYFRENLSTTSNDDNNNKKRKRSTNANSENDPPSLESSESVDEPSIKKKKNMSKEAGEDSTTLSKTESKPKEKKSSSTKTRTKKKKKKNQQPLKRDPPPHWQDVWSLVQELRADQTAPVDSMGAESVPQRHLGERIYRFQVLIALMLSSQTKDAVVAQAMQNLQKDIGLSVENLLVASPETIHKCIAKVGFHNNKLKYIQQVVKKLHEEYDNDVPKTAEEMIDKLPGVGPKMAYLVELLAWNTTSGIGVDTHMHRMFKDLHWVDPKNSNPEQTRRQLEAWLPRKYWSTVNVLWVGLGQELTQQQPKLLKKALGSSRPKEALQLLKRLGLDYNKWGKKLQLKQAIEKVMENQTEKKQ